jgi:hypothetical protein
MAAVMVMVTESWPTLASPTDSIALMNPAGRR